MKEPVLVVIKPDGIKKGIMGDIMSKFFSIKMELVAAKVVKVSRNQALEHYQHLKSKSFFDELINYLVGTFHGKNKVLALIYYGENAIEESRKLAGATNPQDADPDTIRGVFGQISEEGLFENVVHVSSDPMEAAREIKLWFQPDEIILDIYPSIEEPAEPVNRRVWDSVD